MSLATIATAWCAYQAAQWDGEQAFLLNESSAAGRQATLWSSLANQRRMMDGVIFMNWVGAVGAANDSLADFYEQRFRAELEVAVDAWLATDPLDNPDAPPHPFVMEDYRISEDTVAARHADEAAARVLAARQVDGHSDEYVLLTVVFASVLFFGGIGTKFSSAQVRKTILGFGTLILVSAAAALLTFPVSHG
jgi:hypothetical protein